VTQPANVASVPDASRRVRSYATVSLFAGVLAIAVGYASAFMRGGAPPWGVWLLAIGIPISLTAVMVLGATRGRRGIGSLKTPFTIVFLMLAIGFGAAISLPANESANSPLWLGLPMRAAIIIYGIGLLPIFILPIAYAVTFEAQTLDSQDLEKVRALGRRRMEAESHRLAQPRDESMR
jgi:hypothetical protein